MDLAKADRGVRRAVFFFFEREGGSLGLALFCPYFLFSSEAVASVAALCVFPEAVVITTNELSG